MKKIITLCLVLFSPSASAQTKKIIYTDSVQTVRNSIVRELINVGFHVEDHQRRTNTTYLINENGPGSYNYHIIVSRKSKKVIIDTYTFVKPGYNPKWASWDGVDHMTDLIEYAVKKASKEDVLEQSIWSWHVKKSKNNQ